LEAAPNTSPYRCRGVRGAITVDYNTRESLLRAARELLEAIIEANQIAPEDIASVFFTTTPDLNAEFPAVATRDLDWANVAMLCGHEMAVPHGLQQCLRVLIHWNTTRTAAEIRHVYLKGAQALRPDRAAISADQHQQEN